MFRTYIGSADGVYRLEEGALTHLGLEGKLVWAIYAFNRSAENNPENDIILAGSYGDGLFRSDNGGATWSCIENGLTISAFRTFLTDPADPQSILLGGEPGRAFRSSDNGLTWQELTGFTTLPEIDDWYLPYSPRAGAIRNFYSPPNRPQTLFASVEVGGLLRSDDGGATWKKITVLDDEDMHFITGHPDNANELWVSMGWVTLNDRLPFKHPALGGMAHSTDGGKSWQKVIPNDYTRAMIVPPAHPDLILAAPGRQVNHEAQIVVSADKGITWQFAGYGIENPIEDTIELFVAAPDDSIWAICSEGRLFWAKGDSRVAAEWQWQSALDKKHVANIKVKSVAFISTSA